MKADDLEKKTVDQMVEKKAAMKAERSVDSMVGMKAGLTVD